MSVLFLQKRIMANTTWAPIISFIAKEVYKIVSKSAKSNNKILKVNEKNVEQAIDQHISKINTFTSEISFKELDKPKSLFAIYIPLDISLRSLESSVLNNSFKAKAASELIQEVFRNSENNVVLVGSPGSGKTTTIKYICQKLLQEEYYLQGKLNFPILIRLREDDILNNEAIPLFEYILGVFGITIENAFKCSDPEDDKNQLDRFKKQTAISIINSHMPLLILDGLDEVSDNNLKDKLIKNIIELSLTAGNGRFILTTRKGDDYFHINNTQVFELAPLGDEQIKIYSCKWLGEARGASFLADLTKSSVFDSARRPLTLSHLCAIYEREGQIPEKSKSIYKKIVNLLILDWNIQNQVIRKSKFASFEEDRKKEFLENIAFELSVYFNKNQFTTNDLQKCYSNMHMKYNLLYTQMSEVINEIQVHNGLIIQVGFDKYEFAHKSFQEYLAAEYIVKLPKIPTNYDLLKIPSEMALAVALSSEATDYFNELVEVYLIRKPCDFTFLKSFLTRISIEKPDFTDTNSFGLALLKLQDKYCREIAENPSISHSADTHLKLLDDAFKNLLWFENILNCFTDFRDYFKLIKKKGNINYLVVTPIQPYAGNHFPESFIVSECFHLTFLPEFNVYAT